MVLLERFFDSGIRPRALGTSIPVTTEGTVLAISEHLNNGTAGGLLDPNSTSNSARGIVILNAQDVDVTNCVLNENIFTPMRGFNITKFTMENCHCDDGVATDQQVAQNSQRVWELLT